MATISRLSVKLNADPNPLRRGIKKAGAIVKRFTSKIFSLKSAIVGALGGVALGATLGESLKLWGQQERAVASLDASIKSMKRNTSGLSSDLQSLASQIQREGIIGDEAILQGASFLTTYDKITDDMLPRTVRVMADLSAKMGGDTTRAANLLGKASMGLVGSLSIAGISLSDATKKSKNFNDILTEIESQVGGMNKSLGSTASGALLKFSNAMGDLKETLGGVVAVAIEPFVASLTLAMGGAGKSMKEINVLGEKLRSWMIETGKSASVIADAWSFLGGLFDGVKMALWGVVGGIVAVLHAGGKLVNAIQKYSGLGFFFDPVMSESSFSTLEGWMDTIIKKTEKLKSTASSGLLTGFEALSGTGTGLPSDRLKIKIDEFAFQAQVDMMASRLGLDPQGTFRQESQKPPGKLETLTVPQIEDTNSLLRDIRRDGLLSRRTFGVAG